jgi:hypothetical protein
MHSGCQSGVGKAVMAVTGLEPESRQQKTGTALSCLASSDWFVSHTSLAKRQLPSCRSLLRNRQTARLKAFDERIGDFAPTIRQNGEPRASGAHGELCISSKFVKERCGIECGASEANKEIAVDIRDWQCAGLTHGSSRWAPRSARAIGLSQVPGLQNRESIVAARILMVLSASIVFTLGAVHLVYTFRGPELTPRDPALQVSMSQISPVITKETTMWRCWVGFNASHSMGLILFGLVFGYLALAHGQLLFQSPFLLVVGLAMLVGLLVLCKVYFFGGPLTGIAISMACYVASIALSRA